MASDSDRATKTKRTPPQPPPPTASPRKTDKKKDKHKKKDKKTRRQEQSLPGRHRARRRGCRSRSNVDPEKIVEVGSQKVNVKPGSIDDVSAVGNRDIGGRGMGNWYSTDTEIKMGKITPRRSRRAPASSPIPSSPST